MSTRPAPLLAGPTARAVGAACAIALAVLVAYTLGSGDRGAAQATTFVPTTGASPSASSGGVDVVGTGKIAGTPDILRLDLGVTTTRPQAAASLDASSAAANKVLRALRAGGVRSADIKTSGLSLQPDYDYVNSTTKIRGYTATQQIAVKLRNLRNAGAAIAAAVKAGGDATRVNGLALDLDGDSKLLTRARLAAIADAKSKAQAYAKAAGRSLGQVTVISENTTGPEPIQLERNAMNDMAGMKVPVQAGSQQVSVSVRVVWSFA